MKNVIKSIAAFAFAALAIVSCKNSEIVPDAPKGPTHTVKFTADLPVTKTNMDIDPDSKVVTYTWSEEDLLRLSVTENGVEGEIDLDNSEISPESLVIYATFEGEETTEPKVYSAVLNGVVAEQTPRIDENSYDEDADVLIAKPITASSADGIAFQFKRVVAVNKMNLLDLPVGDILTSVTITSDQPISGIIDGDDWAEEMLDNTIVLSVNKIIPSDGKLTLYYMAIPVEGANLTVDAIIGSDSYRKKFGKTLTTKAGDVKGYSVGLKKQAHTILTENFNSNQTTSTTYGGTGLTSDIASDWDYSWNFSSDGIYVNKNSIRFGTGTASKTGYVRNTSILSGIPDGTEFVVNVYAAIWDNGTELKVTYGSDSRSATPANGQVSGANTANYSADNFINANSFSFTKSEGENTLTIGNVTRRLMVDKVEVIYDGDAPSTINASSIEDVPAAGVTDATFNFSVVNIIGNPSVAPDGAVVSSASVEGNTVTYTVSENPTYAAREGSITITVGEETKTVLVSQLGKVASYTGEGTAESPYTVADALLKIETLASGTSSDEVYVAGTIKSISIDDFSESYGNITYVIEGDDESTLQIYRGFDFDGKKFSAASDLAVGQNVVVCGSLKDYSGTKEMDAKNKLVSVNGKTYVLKSISVTGAKTAFYQGDKFSTGEAVVTASYRGSKPDADITSSAQFDGYDASQIGTQDIMVSYTEDGITKTTAYQIFVADPTEYEINVAEYDESKGAVTVTADGTPVSAARIGTDIVVTVNPEAGFVVDQFTVNGESKKLTNGVYQFTMSNSAVAIAVTFKVKPAGYERVTEVSQITSGDYVIAALVDDKYYAMPTTLISNPKGVEITVDSDVISAEDAEDYVWSVTKDGTAYTFAKGSTRLAWYEKANFSKYIDGEDNATWTIAIGTSTAAGMKGGTFAIKNKASASTTNPRFIIYNGTQFAPYTETNTSNSYYYVELFKLEDNRADQTIEFTSATGTYDINESGTRSIPTLNGALTTVTYSSSDETVVEVDASTGAVTNAKKTGSVKITATAAANETYKAATAEYTLNVVDSTPKTNLAAPTNLQWNAVAKVISWDDTNTGIGTYGTNYKYQYSIGDEDHYTDTSSAEEQTLTITSTQTVYVKAVAITTSTHNSSSSESIECTVSGPAEHEVTYTLSNADSPQTVDSNIRLTFEANGGTSPAWYDPEVRTYEKNITTLSCNGGVITSIVFTYSISNSGSLTASPGDYDSSSKTWTGSAESVSFTTGHSSGTKNGQVRISKIVVKYSK